MTKNQINKDINKYLKRIKKELTCSSNLKYAFIHDYKEQINDYINENDNVIIGDIIDHFGNAKEIADSFKDINYDERLNKLAKKYMFIKIITIFLSVIIVIAIFIIVSLFLLSGDTTIVRNY